MNTDQLTKHLSVFRKWFKANKVQANIEQQEREQLSETIQQYTKERLQKMSEEEFFDYIAPLWAMAMWGNKHYQVDNIIEANGMPLLREQFANLIYGSTTLEKRWDEFRSKIKGVGPAIMSELLCKTFPNEYLIWNRKTYNGFTVLEIPNLPRYEARLNGRTYEVLSKHGRDIVELAQKEEFTDVSDLLTLNTFIWQELQRPFEECTPSAKIEALSSKNRKDDLFIHNDIRDKLAEIGRCLGFRAEVEKKVADGAVVDTIWEVTIGNMGRVIYVFEVQTSGSIDSLILNLMKAKNNKALQGIVAVTDEKQIEKIKKEIAALPINEEVKFWNYEKVLKVHESLQYVNESINNLGLVPLGL
ncbi:MAG: hypothetical protein RR259_08670 [Odoribacter sp.]